GRDLEQHRWLLGHYVGGAGGSGQGGDLAEEVAGVEGFQWSIIAFLVPTGNYPARDDEVARVALVAASQHGGAGVGFSHECVRGQVDELCRVELGKTGVPLGQREVV